MTSRPLLLTLAPRRGFMDFAPGLLLCLAVALAALALQWFQVQWLGRAWLEGVALAIVLGAGLRAFWTPGPTLTAGIEFGARTVLEFAVLLLGATMDAHALAGAGPLLLTGVAGVVALGIVGGYGLGRLLRLPRRLALLIACGNAICGNSAIAAVAPAIGAEAEDVAAAIAFTGVLGVGVVLGLPPLGAALHMDARAFGVFAGLTVYAVPQVLAATAPVSLVSVQVGTLVKLLRVLLLGPVVIAASLLSRAAARSSHEARRPSVAQPGVGRLVPWFIVGFGLLAALRAEGVLPSGVVSASGTAAAALTIVSMAALGLGVDVRALVRAGPRATGAVTLSFAAIAGLALLLVRALAVG